jgi:hypothetical protein
VSGSVAQLPCHNCGYELEGLPESGLCPECAAPIRAALTERAERFGRADLIRMRAGAAVLLLSFLCIGAIAAHLLSYAFGPRRGLLPEPIGMALIAVGGLSWTIGWWIVGGRPESLGRQGTDHGAPVRIAAGVSALLVTASLVAYFGRPKIDQLGGCAAMVLLVMTPVMWLAGFGYLAFLGRRTLRAPRVRAAALTANWSLVAGIPLSMATLGLYGPRFPVAVLCYLCLVGGVCAALLLFHAHASLKSYQRQ